MSGVEVVIMDKEFIYDKYSSSIDITYKRQKVKQTGTIQTVLALEIGNDEEKKEIILGSLESLESFKDGTLSRDIRDILENGNLVSQINSLTEKKDKTAIDEKLDKLYASLKIRGFYFSKEGYRILNSHSKDKLDTITDDDITISLSDEPNVPIRSRYEMFKTGETFEKAERQKNLKANLKGMVNNDDEVAKKQNTEKVKQIINKIIEDSSVIDKAPYDRVYKEMKDIVEFQHGATNKEVPEKVEDVINAFVIIYDTARISKLKENSRSRKSNADKNL